MYYTYLVQWTSTLGIFSVMYITSLWQIFLIHLKKYIYILVPWLYLAGFIYILYLQLTVSLKKKTLQ